MILMVTLQSQGVSMRNFTEVVVRFFVYSPRACLQCVVSDNADLLRDIFPLLLFFSAAPVPVVLIAAPTIPSQTARSVLLLLNQPLGRELVTSCCSAPLSKGA